MLVEVDTHVAELFRASGVNILGRSAAPEYSMAATTESVLFGNTCNPWKQGYSAGGSTGGGQAAVTSGMVPLAHGSDIGGSLRIPASWCGGVALKPSRGRISSGPSFDEGGFGMTSNLVQARTVRDVAAMLDCMAVPQVGDPFLIPKPAEPYASLAAKAPPRLRIGIVLSELFGVTIDPEVRRAVQAAGQALAAMGHEVEEAEVDIGGLDAMRNCNDVFFFAYDVRLDGYAKRSGGKPGPDTLEPVTLSLGQVQSEPARRVGGQQRRAAAGRTLPVHGCPQHHGHAGHVVAARHAFDGCADRRAGGGPPRRRASGAAVGHRAGAGYAVARSRAAAACGEAGRLGWCGQRLTSFRPGSNTDQRAHHYPEPGPVEARHCRTGSPFDKLRAWGFAS
jgi:hypothetical protein